VVEPTQLSAPELIMPGKWKRTRGHPFIRESLEYQEGESVDIGDPVTEGGLADIESSKIDGSSHGSAQLKLAAGYFELAQKIRHVLNSVPKISQLAARDRTQCCDRTGPAGDEITRPQR